MDTSHHATMLQLHQKVNPSEKVVGWYATGLGVSGSDALIQEFYSHDCQNPVSSASSRMSPNLVLRRNWQRTQP